jgi:alkylation response protein AidB-like acyl-CoA dehydrogenase
MDLELSTTESDIADACRRLLMRHAGAARAKRLLDESRADLDLLSALNGNGYLDVFAEEQAGPAAASLIVELVAEHAGVVSIGPRALVGPALFSIDRLPASIAIARCSDLGMVRFGGQAEALLLIDGAEARLLGQADWVSSPVASKYGYPFARVEITGDGDELGSGAGAVANRWWMVALASEIAGTASAAVELTTRYVKEREQFGKPLGANQALAHRLVECAVHVEGVRWLARQAATLGAPLRESAAAAVAACKAAVFVARETHQLTGAMGFTVEYDLHVWSLRLHALRVEAGGMAAHAEALVQAKWP